MLALLISEDLLSSIKPVLEDITKSTAAGTAFVIGLGGAVVAIVLWVIISIGCAYYLDQVANFTKTYGSLAGVSGGLLSI